MHVGQRRIGGRGWTAKSVLSDKACNIGCAADADGAYQVYHQGTMGA